MITGPSRWSARVFFFGHLYRSIHLIDEHHVATVYTSPVVRCLSSANVFPLVVDIAPTNSLLLERGMHRRERSQAGKINQRSEMWRDERRKTGEKQMKAIKNQKEHAGKQGRHNTLLIFWFCWLLFALDCVHSSMLELRSCSSVKLDLNISTLELTIYMLKEVVITISHTDILDDSPAVPWHFVPSTGYYCKK